MNVKTEKQFKRIDAKLLQLLNELSQYSDEKLNSKPSSDSWSTLQVIHHLMLAENLSAKYIQKKLSFNPKLKNVNILTGIRMVILKNYNLLPIKLKAPKNVSVENLPEQSSLSEASQQWLAQRAALRAYLETLPEEIFRKELYKHPIAGRLSLYGMLAFFEGHFDRHLKQIHRILAS